MKNTDLDLNRRAVPRGLPRPFSAKQRTAETGPDEGVVHASSSGISTGRPESIDCSAQMASAVE